MGNVRKGGMTVETMAMRDGQVVAGRRLSLVSSAGEWRLGDNTGPAGVPRKVGIPPGEFVALVKSLPLGPKVLSITVVSEAAVRIRTGRVQGALAGAGKLLRYEKQDGEWKQTGERGWIS